MYNRTFPRFQVKIHTSVQKEKTGNELYVGIPCSIGSFIVVSLRYRL